MKVFIKKNWHLILGFLIPIILMLLHATIRHVWFTGSGSILIGDSMEQILPIYHEFWNKVHNGESLIYTWNIGGGLDFTSLMGYVMSPFSLLILLAPKTQIANMLQFVILLKWACISLTGTYFFYYTKFNQLKNHKELFSLFLGLGFSLSNSIIYYFGYPQMIDPIICFPILLLLMEKMFDEGKWKAYYLLLTLCMITNLYTSYAICIFLCMWFVFLYEKKYQKNIKRIFIKFVGASLLSAITVLGGIFSGLSTGADRATQEGVRSEYVFKLLVSPVDFLKQFFVFHQLSIATDITPNIYISVIGIMLVVFLLFLKIKKEKKIKLIIFIIFMIASVMFGALSLFWHLFTMPHGVYHRQIYLLSFLFMLVVLFVIQELETLKYRHIIIASMVELIALLFVFFNISKYDSYLVYLVTFMLFVLYNLLLFFFCKGSIRYQNMILVIAIFGILELGCNAYNALQYYNLASPNSIYKFGAAELLRDDIDMLPGERMQSIFCSNSGPVYGYPSFEGFVSTINQNNVDLNLQLGLGTSGYVSYSQQHATPLENLIYNNRYGVSHIENIFTDAEKTASKEGISLYRSRRLAGLGYMVDEDLLNWDIEDGNCFEIQNQFVKLAVDGDEFMTQIVPVIRAYDADNEGLKIAKKIDNSYDVYYTTKYASIYDTIQIDFDVEHDMDLYMYTVGDHDASDIFQYDIYIDGEELMWDMRNCYFQTIHIGEVKKGQNVSVVRVPTRFFTKDVETSWGMIFAEYDDEAYNKSYEKLSENVYQIDTFEDDYVKGTIHADEDGLMMTSILADSHFMVKVDGEAVEYKTVADTMIAIPLKAGDHTVEFLYKNNTLLIGWIITAGGLLLFIVICIIGRRFSMPLLETEDNETEEVEAEDEEQINDA